MISARRLLKLARKGQKLTGRVIGSADTSSCSTSTMAVKGHFVVYSADNRRFLLPLEYLNNEMIRELFNMAEEVFGLSSQGPLTMPCDAELMEYVISLIKEKVNVDIQKALATYITSCCSWPFYLQNQDLSHQLQICSF